MKAYRRKTTIRFTIKVGRWSVLVVVLRRPTSNNSNDKLHFQLMCRLLVAHAFTIVTKRAESTIENDAQIMLLMCAGASPDDSNWSKNKMHRTTSRLTAHDPRETHRKLRQFGRLYGACEIRSTFGRGASPRRTMNRQYISR